MLDPLGGPCREFIFQPETFQDSGPDLRAQLA